MSEWNWRDLEREAPEVAETLERHFRFYPHSLAAAIGRLLAQRDRDLADLAKKFVDMKAYAETLEIRLRSHKFPAADD